MVVLSFNAGGRRASPLYTVTTLLGFIASLASADHYKGKKQGTHLEVSRQNSTDAGEASDLAECLAATGIQVSLPSSASWTTDTEPWNSRVLPVPAAVVFPATEEEVTAALACAASSGTKVTTLGGNRSFSSMGFGRNDGALIINLINLKVLEYDESSELLTFGGPVVISEAADLLWNEFNRTMPHGRCPDVGISGVSLAGFGTLSRSAGTVLDNIVSVRVAIANGSIVDASADENEDLFWAIRGAAPSFGVVLQWQLATVAAPSTVVTNYTIEFTEQPTQQGNVDALLGLQAWAQSDDNTDLLSARLSISDSVSITGVYYGDQEQFASVSEGLLKNLPSTMAIATNVSDFWDSEQITTPGIKTHTITPRRYFYIASITVPESAPLDNETANALFTNTAYSEDLPDARTGGFVDLWGGSFTNLVAADDTAWKHDGNLLLVRWDMRSSSFDVPFAESSLLTHHDNFYTFVDAYKSAGGTPGGFTTYRDERWTIDETAEYLYGGGNFERLQKIKTEYDPEELFNTDPQSIPALSS